MPRYFFHLRRRGILIVDDEGTELAGIDEARLEAALAARSVIIEILKGDNAVPLHDAVEVVDGRNSLLYTLTFREALSRAVAPAGSPSGRKPERS